MPTIQFYSTSIKLQKRHAHFQSAKRTTTALKAVKKEITTQMDGSKLLDLTENKIKTVIALMEAVFDHECRRYWELLLPPPLCRVGGGQEYQGRHSRQAETFLQLFVAR